MSMTAEKIKVMSAFERGEKVMCRALDLSYAAPCIGEPAWNWDAYVYSIAPKPREWWDLVSVSGGVFGRYSTKERAWDAINGCEGLSIVHVREVIEP